MPAAALIPVQLEFLVATGWLGPRSFVLVKVLTNTEVCVISHLDASVAFPPSGEPDYRDRRGTYPPLFRADRPLLDSVVLSREARTNHANVAQRRIDYVGA